MSVKIAVAASAAVISLLSGPALSQRLLPILPPPDYSKIEIKTTDLGNRTYMLEGEGGNITVAVGDDGVIMVDSEFAPLHDKIKAAVAALTNQPIRYLVNTHFHRDHTGGNEAFGKDGVTIVAHETVKDHLLNGVHNGLTGNVVPPAAPIALPKETFTDGITLHLQGRTAEVKHIAAAHTDGDAYVYFADANVLATGDVVDVDGYPNIDYVYSGGIDGMIRGVDVLLGVGNDATKIVPGHGPLGSRAKLHEYRQMLVDARDRVQKLIAAGKSEEEVEAARPMADYDAKYKVGERGVVSFLRVTYRSLKN
jgi:cyclase